MGVSSLLTRGMYALVRRASCTLLFVAPPSVSSRPSVTITPPLPFPPLPAPQTSAWTVSSSETASSPATGSNSPRHAAHVLTVPSHVVSRALRRPRSVPVPFPADNWQLCSSYGPNKYTFHDANVSSAGGAGK